MTEVAGETPGVESILEEAQRLIHGARQQDYGHPTDNHGRTAALWKLYLELKYGAGTPVGEIPFDAEDVCWFNILQKMGREMHRKTRDGITDTAGYAGNIELIRNRNGSS